MIRDVITWVVIVFICSVFVGSAVGQWLRERTPPLTTADRLRNVRELQARRDRRQLDELEQRWRDESIRKHPSGGAK